MDRLTQEWKRDEGEVIENGWENAGNSEDI